IDGPLLRLLQNFDRVPLVVDSFIPLYDTLVRDRAVATETSARARALLKIAVVPIAQPDPGQPSPLPSDGPFTVVLVATFIPLHGVATVVEAAERLAG